MKRWHKIVAALLGLWVAGEATLYLGFGLGAPALSVADPQIEYLFKPDQDLRRFGNRIRINHWGMRADDFGAKQPGELRVLVWGDSVINGGAPTDQAKLATEIIRRELAQGRKAPVTVGNISAGSWGPPNQLAYARRYGFFDADMNLIVASSHDAFDVPTFAPLNPATHPTTRPLTPSVDLVFRYLIPRLLKTDGDVLPAATSQDNAIPALREFFDLARRATPRLALILHRTKRETTTGRGFSGGTLILQACADSGVTCVDSMDAYRAYEGKQGEMFRDDIHPNENGQQVLAGLMMKLIQP